MGPLEFAQSGCNNSGAYPVFPRPRALDKAFGIIAPDPSERAQEAEEKDLE